MSEEEIAKKWTMPFNIAYDSFQLILKTLFQQKADVNPVSVVKVGSIAGLSPNTISSNMSFLKAINVVTGEKKEGYKLTNLGVEYAKAFYTDDINTIKSKSQEIINNSHLRILHDKIALKKNTITIDEIYSYIKAEGRYAEGAGVTGMTPPYATGSKTLLHIFEDAGFLPESFEIDAVQDSKAFKENRRKTSRTKQTSKQKISRQNQTSSEFDNKLPSNTLGRLIVEGVGTLDINNEDTFNLAKPFMDLLKKKIDAKKSNSNSPKEKED